MFDSLKKRGGTIVVAAIVGAVAAGSPAVAAEVVAFAKSAGNANTVNKIGASKTPRAGMLVPLNAKGKFPASVIPASRAAIGKAGPAGPQGAGHRARRVRQARMERPGAGAAGPQGVAGAQGRKETRAVSSILARRRQPKSARLANNAGATSLSTAVLELTRIARRSRRRPDELSRVGSAAGCRHMGHGSDLRQVYTSRHPELLARRNRPRCNDRRVHPGRSSSTQRTRSRTSRCPHPACTRFACDRATRTSLQAATSVTSSG